MNSNTKKQTIEATRDLFQERQYLIGEAIVSTERARDNCGYMMAIESALASLRMAQKQMEIELDNQIKYWEGKE